jgi:hypothetical protein
MFISTIEATSRAPYMRNGMVNIMMATPHRPEASSKTVWT